jgi:hypothetical protein
MYFATASSTEDAMLVKRIAQVTYWLGMACVVAAVFSRLMTFFGFEMTLAFAKSHPIDFHSFLDAALLFLFSSMASSLYARLEP